jgi:hypothetical protein
MHPYKSVYWINFDMATELIAHGRQHLSLKAGSMPNPIAEAEREFTGLSTPPVRRSTSFCRLNATQQRLSAFSPKPCAERTIRRRA